MTFQFLGACRQREGDQDKFVKHFRMLQIAYIVALLQSLLWAVDSAWEVAHGNKPADESSFQILFSSIILVVFLVSFKAGEPFSKPLRRHHVIPLLMAILLIVAETMTALGWREFHGMLGSWRQAVVVALGASLVLWMGKRTIVRLRSGKWLR